MNCANVRREQVSFSRKLLKSPIFSRIIETIEIFSSFDLFFVFLRSKIYHLFVAQLVEQLTLNQWVRGSSPREETTDR
jgi:hypothetical protein